MLQRMIEVVVTVCLKPVSNGSSGAYWRGSILAEERYILCIWKGILIMITCLTSMTTSNVVLV